MKAAFPASGFSAFVTRARIIGNARRNPNFPVVINARLLRVGRRAYEMQRVTRRQPAWPKYGKVIYSRGCYPARVSRRERDRRCRAIFRYSGLRGRGRDRDCRPRLSGRGMRAAAAIRAFIRADGKGC